MIRPSLKEGTRYSTDSKLTVVKLGVEVQTVATALDIHPFMLAR